MASTDIIDGAKLSFQYHTDVWVEDDTWGVHTGLRDVDDVQDLLSAFLEAAQDAVNPYMVPCHMNRVTYSVWSTVGFTGWHQLQVLEDDRNFGGGTALPHQNALVIGVRNTTESTDPLGRRRNRSYIGPLRTSVMDADTRLSAETRDAIGGLWVDLSTALGTVPALATAYNGLCVASPAGELLYTGDEARVGQRIDTHRSRAQKVAETPASFAL